VLKIRAKTKADFKAVRNAARKGSITSLGKAGAYVRGIAMRSIKVSPDKSEPGKPPHTREGRLKNAIIYSVEKELQDVVIGPNASEVGKIGSTHEFGGVEPPKKPKKWTGFKLQVGGTGPIRTKDGKIVVTKLMTDAQVRRAAELAHSLPAAQSQPSGKPRNYSARPFMGPALMRAKERLPHLWERSIRKE